MGLTNYQVKFKINNNYTGTNSSNNGTLIFDPSTHTIYTRGHEFEFTGEDDEDYWDDIDVASALKFTALSDGSTIKRVSTGYSTHSAPNIQYSHDGLTWENWTNNAVITLNTGESIFVKGSNPSGFSYSEDEYTSFKMTSGNWSCIGDVMMLIGEDTNTIPCDYCFYKLFEDSICLSNISQLRLSPTTMTNHCYESMFVTCTGLTNIPSNFLPSTTLASFCYAGMFTRCSGLTNIPSNFLPSTTLASFCYSGMFSGCTGLTTTPSNLLPVTSLAPNCYQAMFYGCKGLTSAPILPATSLAPNCYQAMFYQCTALQTIKVPGFYSWAKTVSPSNLSSYTSNWITSSGITTIETGDDLETAMEIDEFAYSVTTLGNYIGIPAIIKHIKSSDGLCFTSYNPSLYPTITISGSYTGSFSVSGWHKLYYSFDGQEWIRWNGTSAITGTTIYVKGNTFSTIQMSASNYYKFDISSTQHVSCSGSIMKLINQNHNSLSTPYAFYHLFKDCQGLYSVITLSLPENTLSRSCYESMFQGCTNLCDTPVFPTTQEVSPRCYASMFRDCTSLDTIPVLSATTLYEHCYAGMFMGCTNLMRTPSLPATSLAAYCYDRMFEGCTSLIRAPHLPATTFSSTNTPHCYDRMFYGCSNLNYIKADFLSAPSTSYMENWVYGVANSGTFVKNANATWNANDTANRGVNGVPYNWVVEGQAAEDNNCLTFSGEGTVYIDSTGSFYTSRDKITWASYMGDEKNVTSSQPLYIKGDNFTNGTKFGISKTASQIGISISGNLMSLVDEDATEMPAGGFEQLFSQCDGIVNINGLVLPSTNLVERCYFGMFKDCTGLTSIPSGLLPAINLVVRCYDSMFWGCTGLTSIPSGLLPSNNLASYCYASMFYGCTGLTNIPSGLLPSNNLASYCYASMFQCCTGLTSIPSGSLPVMNLKSGCYAKMFQGCTGLTSIPSGLLPATNLNSWCYEYMFYGCTGLTSIPSGLLPATNLDSTCYEYMFYGCTGLTSIPSGLLPANNLTVSCYASMFKDCTGLTSIPSGLLPAMNLNWGCYKSMFNGCTGLATAPNLPATILASNCYQDMFYGCSSLNYIKADFLSAPSSAFSSNWVNGVANSGTFVKNPDATWLADDYRGVDGVPLNWNVVGESSEEPEPTDAQWILDSSAWQQWQQMTEFVQSDWEDNWIAFESYSNKGVSSSFAKMKFSITGYESFTFKVAANAEQGFDFCYVNNVNDDHDPSTFGSFSSTNNISIKQKINSNTSTAHGSQLSDYTDVTFTGLTPSDTYTINVYYRKDSSGDGGLDKGFVLLPLEGMNTDTWPEKEGLKFTAISNGNTNYNANATLWFRNSSGNTNPNDYCLLISRDKKVWKRWQSNTHQNIESSPLYVKGITSANDTGGTVTFLITCVTSLPVVTISGNVNLLLGESNQQLFESCFDSLFANMHGTMNLLNLQLPSTVLAKNCYNYMFHGCRILNIPSNFLPAVNIEEKCYYGMFSGCVFSEELPNNLLPATTLAKNCYCRMFSVSNITSIPETFLSTGVTLAENCYNEMFYGCDALTSINLYLPALYLESSCYKGMFSYCSNLQTINNNIFSNVSRFAPSACFDMFRGCENLMNIPTLNITGSYENTLEAFACFQSMFSNCISLTSSSLSSLTISSTIGYDAFSRMFSGCTGITEIPPSLFNFSTPTQTPNSCFVQMFKDCTGLTTLPSQFLKNIIPSHSCYRGMFSGCTSLTEIPSSFFDNVELAAYCYNQMFQNCTNLRTVGRLPATSLTQGAYEEMFDGCSSLSYIRADFLDEPSEYSMENWVNGVASTGTFVKNPDAEWSADDFRGPSGIPVNWTVEGETSTTTDEGLKFLNTALVVKTIKITKGSSAPTISLVYKLEGSSSWTDWDLSDISVPARTYVLIRAKTTNNAMASGSSTTYANYFTLSGQFKVSGNVMYLLDSTGSQTIMTTTNNYAFAYLFYNSTYVVNDGILLPATTLANYCYYNMFYRCTNLGTCPNLPATTLATYCYAYMFYYCSNITTPPILQATTLQTYCYAHMFRNCTSLTTAPYLPSESVLASAYYYMFCDCSNLTTVQGFNIKSGSGTYSLGSMFRNCTKLRDASNCIITGIGSSTYTCYYMFYGCVNLTNPPILSSTTVSSNCYSYMFYNCTSLTTPPALPASTLKSNCYYNMFSGCTGLTSAPKLPATTLVTGCYNSMFYNCTNLTSIYANFTTTPSTTYCQAWVSGINTIGTFHANSSASWTTSITKGVSTVPTSWTIEKNYS